MILTDTLQVLLDSNIFSRATPFEVEILKSATEKDKIRLFTSASVRDELVITRETAQRKRLALCAVELCQSRITDYWCKLLLSEIREYFGLKNPVDNQHDHAAILRRLAAGGTPNSMWHLNLWHTARNDKKNAAKQLKDFYTRHGEFLEGRVNECSFENFFEDLKRQPEMKIHIKELSP